MSLTSLVFVLFCIITFFLYFIVPKKIQWLILLIASLIFLFYDNFSVFTVLQLLIVILSSYFFGRLVDKYRDTKRGKVFLALGIIIILGLLIYLKYTNLFLTTFNHFLMLFGNSYRFELVHRTSLIGISYWSLIMISYLIDVHRGAIKSEKNILKLSLFMSYFPILTSGPFIRYDDFKDQVDRGEKKKFSYDALCSGLVRILWGLFKILVISQRLGYFVDHVYGHMVVLEGMYIFLAACFFVLQLYTNFSGSIDIIMGVSEILGIKLPENFKAPFFATTITEFWRNWHITLGAWLKDYIFYPLLKSNFMQSLNKKCKNIFGKKISKKIPLYLSMLIMWTLIGIWHGGAYTYIIGSGLLQFIFIFLEDVLEPVSNKINKKLGINTDTFSYRLYQRIRTFLLFSFSMIFFRAVTVNEALSILQNMFVWTSLTDIGEIMSIANFIVMFLGIGALLVVEYLMSRNIVSLKFKNRHRDYLFLIIFIFVIILFGIYGVGFDKADFIYNRF